MFIQNVLGGFLQQIGGVVVMQIKCGTIDTGGLTNFLYGDKLKILLLQKSNEGIVHFLRCTKIFAFISVHQTIPLGYLFAFTDLLGKLKDLKGIFFLSFFQ